MNTENSMDVLETEWTRVNERGCTWTRLDGRTLWITIIPAGGSAWSGLAFEMDGTELSPGVPRHNHQLLFTDAPDTDVDARVSAYVETWLGHPPGLIVWIDPVVLLRVVCRDDGRRMSAVLSTPGSEPADTWTAIVIEAQSRTLQGVLEQHTHQTLVVGVPRDHALKAAETAIRAFQGGCLLTAPPPWCPCRDIGAGTSPTDV